jgi:hypothetical protein
MKQNDQPDSDTKPFWFTQCEGVDFRDVTKDPGYGSSKPAVIVRVTDQLILAPPASVFPHYLGDNPKGPDCRHIDDLPQVTTAYFTIRASTLRGPDPATLPKPEGKPDPDLVKVYVMGGSQVTVRDLSKLEDERRAEYEQEKSKGHQVATTEYGLRCYGYPNLAMSCFGSTTGASSPNFSATVSGLVIGVQAHYLSQKYGGVEIDWLTGHDALPKWMDIANQIAVDLDQWNARAQ